jgi:hypothetical protein
MSLAPRLSSCRGVAGPAEMVELAPGRRTSSPGTIVVVGPRAWEFCDRFCSHKVGLLKADGKDILAVIVTPRAQAAEQ